jgi:small subunit ribosomal protein S2
MRRVPNAVFVVDPKLEHNAVAEAKKLGIPVFGILDTNADPEEVTYGIPANDDATKAIKLIVGLMADAVVEAKDGQTTVAYGVQPDEEVSMVDAINSFDKAEELKLIKAKKIEDALATKRSSGRKPAKKFTPKAKATTAPATEEKPAAPVAEEPKAE